MAPGKEVQKGLDNVIVEESSIAFIDGQRGVLKLYGFTIEELAERSSFEEVAFLIWNRRLPRRTELEGFRSRLRSGMAIGPEAMELIRDFPREAHPMDVMRTATSALALYDPRSGSTDPSTNMEMAMDIQSKVPAMMAAFNRMRNGLEPLSPLPDLGLAANYYYMLTGERPSPRTERGIDRSFILYSEHELNASAFAGMVTASTLADMYASVTAAMGALKGPLHGGANEAVIRMLSEIGDPSRAEGYIMERIRRKEKVMGFGHRVYRTYDPRARIFRAMAEELLPEVSAEARRIYEVARSVEEVVVRELGPKGIYPNTDFWNAIYYYFIGIPIDYFTVNFGLARISGWVSHVLEYWQDNRLIRPRSKYVGPERSEYIPLDKR